MRCHRVRGLLLGIAGVTLAAASARGAEPPAITLSGLLEDMTDLAGICEFPLPPYSCRQFSSYDRASKSPAENWFANGDAGNFLRVEERGGRREFVMMEADGPGAIVRIWSANPAGNLRIYLDGEEAPAIEAKMADLLGGNYPGLPRPIAGEYGKGWNLYFPIPYAKRCKVTADKGGFYYHVNYRTSPPGTRIEPFRADMIRSLEGEIRSVIARLSAPGEAAAKAGGDSRPFAVEVEPGASVPLAAIQGPKAISSFRVDWPRSEDRDEPPLRAVVLEMTFDGERTVVSPLGDFFGTGPGLNPYESLPLGVSKDGRLDCRWVMPFRDAAEIRARNLGKAPVLLRGAIETVPHAWNDSTMHFCAKWKAAFEVSTDPKFDWNYLALKGKGVFAGVAFAIDNPVRAWWGEGDEKIYVDGESFPSHFGTGTEDYYGYGWGFPGLFAHAYHSQPRCDGPGNYGRTSVNRWHILDRIPFTKDFRFDMEIWHWKKCKVNLAVIAYYYSRPGATDSFAPIAPKDVAVRPLPEEEIFKVKGAIEGERMRIVHKTGTPGPQDWEGTSEGRHLWWHGGQKPGDTLVLGFNVGKAGKYRISAGFLKAADYGIAQVAINGAKAGEPIDFYNDGVILWGPVELGTFALEKGENTIAFIIVGANEKAVRSYMVGLDYLLLKPAD